jgi:hypothetical protein
LSSRKDVVRTVNAGRLVAAATGAVAGSTATLGLDAPITPTAIAKTAITPPPAIHFLLFIFIIAFMC